VYRLTARILLLFSLVGVLAPAALAFSVDPPHACCRRKTPHCHNAGMPTDGAALYASGCGQHSCCRGLTVAQIAHPKPQATALFAPELLSFFAAIPCATNSSATHSSHFVRGPPVILAA
jgi:hypothetical protein